MVVVISNALSPHLKCIYPHIGYLGARIYVFTFAVYYIIVYDCNIYIYILQITDNLQQKQKPWNGTASQEFTKNNKSV